MCMLPATGLVGARTVRNFIDMATARHSAGLPLPPNVGNQRAEARRADDPLD